MHKALQKKYAKPQDDPNYNGTSTETAFEQNPFASTTDNYTANQNSNGFQKDYYEPTQTETQTSNRNNTIISSYGSETKLSRDLETKRQFLELYNAPKPSCRVTSDCFPRVRKAQKSTRLPLCAVIMPYSSVYPADSFPTAHYGTGNEVFRCESCHAYINPFTEFLADGSNYRCNLCRKTHKTPDCHYAELDKVTNERIDKNERIELFCGLFDIKAGTDYMARPPMPPTYLFLVDVSKDAVASGMLDFFVIVLNDAINNQKLPGDSRAQIAIFTYDSQLHYYIISPDMKSPQMVVLSDPGEFEGAPFPNEVIVNISENKTGLVNFISSLTKMFATTKDNGSCLLAAIASITKATKHMGGRLFILQASSSIIHEPGLEPTSEQIDKKQFFGPTSTATAELASPLHHNFFSCYFFIFSSSYKNVITLGDIAKYTGGELYYYLGEKPERNRKFFYEFKNCLIRETPWEAVFRLRISAGWRIVQRYGNYAVKNADLLSLPNVDESKGMVYEFELEDEAAETDTFFMQSVLLYTTSKGERRLRIINYGVLLSESLQDVFSHIDAQALGVVLLRRTFFQLRKTQDILTVRSDLIQLAKSLVQDMCTTCKITQKGCYIESMTALPLIILSFLKHAVFSPYNLRVSKEMDYISALRLKLNFLSIEETMLHFVPYLFPIHTMAEENAGYYAEDGNFVFPQLLSLTIDNLKTDGIYLMDDGESIYMLVGSKVSPGLLRNLFGIEHISEIPKITEDHLYHNSNDPVVEGLFKLISELRLRHCEKYVYLRVIKQGEKSKDEFDFYSKLAEDKNDDPHAYSVSYSEFANMIHKGSN